MAADKYSPGGEVDAWCTKCRMDLNHVIIAVVGSDIKKVKCLTCGGEHKYHPPKSEKTVSKPTAKSKTTARGPAAGKPRTKKSAEGEWNTFMKELDEAEAPRAYRINEIFSEGEFLEHKNFGVGKVLNILGSERMEVVFREGRKVLLYNKSL
jgi:hypothetical protein